MPSHENRLVMLYFRKCNATLNIETHGKTYEEAIKNGQKVLGLWMEAIIQNGRQTLLSPHRELTPEENRLVEHAKEAITRYNTIRHAHGGIDTLYAFILSNSGTIHDGACYEPDIAHATVCGERHAITNMILQESYKAKMKCIVVADPVPEVQARSRPPCGTCRHLIWSHGTPETTVVLMQYIQRKHGWTFPRLEKYSIKDFYPYPYEPVEGLWDNWQPE